MHSSSSLSNRRTVPRRNLRPPESDTFCNNILISFPGPSGENRDLWLENLHANGEVDLDPMTKQIWGLVSSMTARIRQIGSGLRFLQQQYWPRSTFITPSYSAV